MLSWVTLTICCTGDAACGKAWFARTLACASLPARHRPRQRRRLRLPLRRPSRPARRSLALHRILDAPRPRTRRQGDDRRAGTGSRGPPGARWAERWACPTFRRRRRTWWRSRSCARSGRWKPSWRRPGDGTGQGFAALGGAGERARAGWALSAAAVGGVRGFRGGVQRSGWHGGLPARHPSITGPSATTPPPSSWRYPCVPAAFPRSPAHRTSARWWRGTAPGSRRRPARQAPSCNGRPSCHRRPG